jgi:putative hydrolase of the HAD superfamily
MKAILFDLDDTLYTYLPSHLAGLEKAVNFLAGPLDLPRVELRKRYLEVRSRASERLGPVAASHSRHLYFKWLLEETQGSSHPALCLEATRRYWEGCLEAMHPVPGCLELLVRLRVAGLALGVLTNLTVEIQLRKLERLGLSEFFSVVVTSEEAGRDKPDPAGFQLALQRLGTSPEETVMIGDNRSHDIEGSAQLGMQPLWISQGQGQSHSLPENCWVAPDLQALLQPEWMQRLGVTSP